MKYANHALATALALSASALAMSGCRRSDVRDYTVQVPGLTAANLHDADSALRRECGIDPSSIRWDLERKTVSLRYESLATAKINILDAIENAGVEVVRPVKKDGPAGYIDTRR